MEKKVKILVVEDERIVAEDIARILRNLGYDVLAIVSSGEDAVKIAEEKLPDLVLMDIMLEGDMNGIEAAGQIFSRFGIPVMYLTAYADDERLQRAKKTEPFGYILKPFEERELYSSIEIALYKHKMEKALVESERRYRLLAENISDVIWTMDMDMRFTYVSSSTYNLTGYTVEEHVNLTLDEFLTPDSFEVASRVFNEEIAIEGSGLSNPSRTRLLELEQVRKDGSTLWVEVKASFLRDPDGRPIGVLGVTRDISERKRAKEELEQSYERLKRTLDGAINALGSTVKMRDPYTADHQQRVAELSCAIAGEMGLSEDQVQEIHIAAVVHDIGKINIPSEILSKPSLLTEIEFKMIKTHSQAGHDILKNINFPWPIAQIVLQHHERMDGSGYPQGLKGEEILLEARIIAVADVVEAMASHRPYRPAQGIEEALKEISRNKGVLYDPQVVDACLKLFTEKGFALDKA
ncbi:MAG: PAS domain S-box protein [Thermodesulfobacteriota bacterium]|nr:PAS domain S-box protein [Thermodesulfobacteriota bacterium]